MQIKFKAKLWEYNGPGPWVFVSLPKNISKEIKKLFAINASSFGSLKVIAVLGGTKWNTSIFPDSKNSIYLLPIKKQVRQKEKVIIGDSVNIELNLK